MGALMHAVRSVSVCACVASTLVVPAHMAVSDAAPVRAGSAADTLGALLPDSANQFAPVSARSRTDEIHVKTIASDGNSGFVVTYVIAGEERSVHLEADGSQRESEAVALEIADGLLRSACVGRRYA